ncbi:MAG: leucyl/phenylalanyl-tRNA--protein transferase [Frankia sp.]
MARSPRPADPGPSWWDQSRAADGPTAADGDPWLRPAADPETPVAIGGDLAPATMIGAYRRGIFPWPALDPTAAADLRSRFGPAVADGTIPSLTPRQPATLDLPWFSPDPRGVLVCGKVHVSRTLAWRMRSAGWTATVDAAFADVVGHCTRGGPHEWITPGLVACYQRLFELGWAHSSEVWDGDTLIGGHFGITIGGAHSCESMFHRVDDASKVALVDFDARFRDGGGRLIDVQLASPHLVRMGAEPMSRADYLHALLAVRDAYVPLERDPLPVARLAPPRQP